MRFMMIMIPAVYSKPVPPDFMPDHVVRMKESG